jgi:hypothetical protein
MLAADGAGVLRVAAADPLREQAAELFAGQLAADRTGFPRCARSALNSTLASPAQRLRDNLATGLQGGWKIPLREQLPDTGVKPRPRVEVTTARE